MYVENGYVEAGYVEGNENVSTETETDTNTVINNHYSLNGSHGSHKDGLKVMILNSKYVYTIIASHFYMSANNQFGIMYILKNEDDKVSYVPADFITKYEAEVTEEEVTEGN